MPDDPAMYRERHGAGSAARRALCATALAVLAFGGSAAEPDAGPYRASAGADGVQRVALVGGSYFFRPGHIVVKAGQPLEISVRMEPGIVPHRFVLEAADGQPLADLPLSTEAKTLRLTLKAGDYAFHCPNQLLGFRSHRERGMAGVLEARE